MLVREGNTNRTDRDEAILWCPDIASTNIGAVFRFPNLNPACVPSITASPSGLRVTCSSPSSPTNQCRWPAPAYVKPAATMVGPVFAEPWKIGNA